MTYIEIEECLLKIVDVDGTKLTKIFGIHERYAD